MNDAYWNFGFIDGQGNFDPTPGSGYSIEQTKNYYAGYRCGVRKQKKVDRKDFQAEDDARKIRPTTA